MESTSFMVVRCTSFLLLKRSSLLSSCASAFFSSASSSSRVQDGGGAAQGKCGYRVIAYLKIITLIHEIHWNFFHFYQGVGFHTKQDGSIKKCLPETRRSIFSSSSTWRRNYPWSQRFYVHGLFRHFEPDLQGSRSALQVLLRVWLPQPRRLSCLYWCLYWYRYIKAHKGFVRRCQSFFRLLTEAPLDLIQNCQQCNSKSLCDFFWEIQDFLMEGILSRERRFLEKPRCILRFQFT